MPRRLVRSGEEPEPEPEPAPVEDVPLLYSADDAARMLGGISKAMVYRYVQKGQLHPTKLGSRTLFSREELERFVKEQGAK
jgi:excisionase family DNA binding protein